MYRLLLIVFFLIVTATFARGQASNPATEGGKIENRTPQLTANENVATKMSRADTVLSRIDGALVRELACAWNRGKHGIALEEALVLIYRMPDGSIKAVQGRRTNEALQVTFEWDQAIYAIAHTHPNKSAPEPQGPDIVIANRFHVPMFTITSSGMFLYDPATKKTTKVQEDLNWLELRSWLRYSRTATTSTQNLVTPGNEERLAETSTARNNVSITARKK